ncbi:helicase-related protein [Nitritalea halalkaliphila]|uniref:helicase-related protein n=1 Tax=Nitritalea halalkaliphila TaxID=590849 RepID=UPI00373FD8D3
MDDSQRKIISSLMQEPVEIRIHHSGAANEQVDQETIQLKEGEDKFLALQQLLGRPDMEKVILFTETKRLADRLTKKLTREGITAGQIHGDKSQNFRNNVLQKFKNGGIRVLVATDVAARGIDVQDVSHVINYQLPLTMDAYIHRVGRTGRAGKTGKAITFLDPKG